MTGISNRLHPPRDALIGPDNDLCLVNENENVGLDTEEVNIIDTATQVEKARLRSIVEQVPDDDKSVVVHVGNDEGVIAYGLGDGEKEDYDDVSYIENAEEVIEVVEPARTSENHLIQYLVAALLFAIGILSMIFFPGWPLLLLGAF